MLSLYLNLNLPLLNHSFASCTAVLDGYNYAVAYLNNLGSGRRVKEDGLCYKTRSANLRKAFLLHGKYNIILVFKSRGELHF